MMNFEQYFESTRRGFLKQLGGAIAGAATGGVDKAVGGIAKAAAPVAGAMKKFKCLRVASSRGEFDIMHVWDAVGKSVKDVTDRETQQLMDDDWERWAEDDPEFSPDDYIPNEFLGGGNSDEGVGLGGIGAGEEDSIYVVSEENPLFSLFHKVKDGWSDMSEKAHDIIQQGIDDWEFGNWEEFIREKGDDLREAKAEQAEHDSEATRAEQEKEWEEARKRGEEAEKEYQETLRAKQTVTITLPRRVVELLNDELVDFLHMPDTIE